MKTNWLVVAIALTLASLNAQSAQSGTAFTYQGRLTDGGNPAIGTFDLRFTIYDSPTNGTALAGPITNSPTSVSNGLFTVTLDFGAGIFTGTAHWLEIAVRPGDSTGSFTPLNPLQPLTAAPYALYAANAGAAATAVAASTANAVSAANINGTIADAQLTANIPRLNVPNTALQAAGNVIVTSGFITGATVTSGGSGYLTPPAVVVNDSTGSNAVITAATSAEGVVTNLSVQNAGSGYSASATLTIALPPSNAYQVFSSTNHFEGVNLLTNVNNVVVGSFTGNGSGLDTLNASALASGTVADGRLAGNVARTNQVWLLGGNAGTKSGVNFLGTTDNQPLELWVNNERTLRLEPTAKGPNVIGGFNLNYIRPPASGSTISGGGTPDFFGFVFSNTIAADFSTINGGAGNTIEAGARFATISGGYNSTIQEGSYDASIGNGGSNAIRTNCTHSRICGGELNTVETGSDHAIIGGGYGNTIQTNAFSSTIGGGGGNTIRAGGDYGTISGGYGNTSSGDFATVGGGQGNTASGFVATVGGGQGNTSSGQGAIVPGGFNNNAAGDYSFAAGNQAKANHQGAFVWADSTSADFASTAMNQFLIRAAGGVGIGTNSPATQLHVLSANQTAAIIDGSSIGGTWLGLGNSSTGGQRWSIISSGSGNGEGAGKLIFFTSQGNARKMMLDGAGNLTINGTLAQGSDRNMKTAFEPVDAGAVLEQVTKLPVMKWAYTNDASVRHLGPMAQDFYASFGVGADDQHIADIDEGGVALAAIQGLNQKLEQKETEITELKRTVNELKELVQAINHKLNIEVR